MNRLKREEIVPILRAAIQEDIGDGDITTDAIVPEELNAEGRFSAKAEGILAGIDIGIMVFELLDGDFEVLSKKEDGVHIYPGDTIAEVRGKARVLLKGERLALNIIQHLSGIATITSKFIEKIKGTKAKILDTRKTTPLLRKFEKYAVKVGGGENHRFGLYDAVLIKDNHIKIAGGIKNALNRVNGEIEVRNRDEFIQALDAGAKRILLDNMDVEQVREIVELNKGRAKLEVSGGITLENVRDYALTGVDFISVGSITHSAPALDISFNIYNIG